MATHKRIDVICIVTTLLTIALTVFLLSGSGLGIVPVVSEAADGGLFTANDLDGDWDTSSATKIVLSDNGSKISGNGAYVYAGDVYIAYGGHYVLTGELTNGSVIIDADKSDKIWISLDGVTLHCDDDAAVRVEQADKVFLTLADGTENTVSSGSWYNEDVTASGVDGVIYSRDDLTINGTGSLVVNAAYNHGIVCNDDLVIAGGDIAISAVQDGIHANDSVCIRSSVITIWAGDDGVTVSNDDETAFLYVESGNITIPSCYEGLEAVDITIADGTIDIMPTDDGINASGSGNNSVIRIMGGNITITNSSGRDADGLDSNGSIYMEGGRVVISVSDSGGNYALDYGSENGGECVVSGGTVIACGGSAMAEGFDAGSTQGFLMYNTAAAAGTTISLEDSGGRELLSEEIPCSFSSVVLSSPELKVGDVCTITVGDVQEQVTIDNSSDNTWNSGFGSAGMFGGGMGNGKNRGGMEPPDGMEFSDGREVPDGKEEPDGREVPDGKEEPDGGVVPDGKEEPDDGEVPDGKEFPDRMDMSDGENWSNRQGMQETSARPFAPEQGLGQGNGMRFPQQDGGQMQSGGDSPFSNIPTDTFVLLGISVLALLLGLFIAMKMKH